MASGWLPLPVVLKCQHCLCFTLSAPNTSGAAPLTLTCLSLELRPEVICTALRETLNALASTRMSSSLAAPSTGGAAIRTRKAPLCSPTIPLCDARGTTCTLNVRTPSFSRKWTTGVYDLINLECGNLLQVFGLSDKTAKTGDESPESRLKRRTRLVNRAIACRRPLPEITIKLETRRLAKYQTCQAAGQCDVAAQAVVQLY